jgi:prepilin-type processing-associated H-X9-DG protein
MRTDSNRLLVGQAGAEEGLTPPPVYPAARRQLAEVIIGVVIVFTCIYVFIPVFTGTSQSAYRVRCVSHLHRLAQALEMYQTDSDGQYPPTGGWVRALYPYVVRPKGDVESDQPHRRFRAPAARGQEIPEGAEVFFCRAEENLPRRRNAAPGTILSSYTYHQPPVTGNSDIPFAWDYLGGTGQGAHPKGGNVGYLDGRAVWKPASQWAAGDQP